MSPDSRISQAVKVIELTEADAVSYKSFFLRGLILHADCFRISLQDADREIFPTHDQPDSFTLAALSETGEWMGIVSFQREGATRVKLRHKGLLFRMYVADEHGGKGVGRELVQEVIRRAKELPNLEQINLTVIGSNIRAKKLYERMGFRTFSVEERAIKNQGEYLTEEQMVLFF
jgi:RimJ/RimL family protein N-acetyltransferase